MPTTLLALRQRALDGILDLYFQRPGYRPRRAETIANRVLDQVQARYPSMTHADVVPMVQSYLDRHPTKGSPTP